MHATVLIMTGLAGLATLLVITDLRAVKPRRTPPAERHGPAEANDNDSGDSRGDGGEAR